MINMREFALNLLSRNSNIANNPQTAEMLNVIRNNDYIRGEEIANNLCNSYGMTKEQAIQRARQFFHI